MPRPRKYGHIRFGRDEFRWSGGSWDANAPYVPTNEEAPFIHGRLTWTDAQREKWRREVGIYTNQPRQHLFERPMAASTRPFGVVFVLDALMRMDPRCEVVGGPLARAMNEVYPFFTFNDVSTGRILKGLSVEAQNQPRPDHGAPAMEMSTSSGNTYYIVEPDHHSWLWLANQREWWSAKAREWMDHWDQHQRWPDEDPWADVPDMDYGTQMFASADAIPRRRR